MIFKKGSLMKRFLISAAIAAAFLTSTAFAADVGVSISVGQPGFFWTT
jgi:ABC-type sugar transport system substrate-binding protein